jgi:hypothetical protein
VWSQQAYLKPSNTDTAFEFGTSVAISGDTIAVGAARESSNATGVNGNQADRSAYLAGAVYVFTRTTAGVWSQQAYIKASNTKAGDQFGTTVSLAGDTLAVGAFRESSAATGINGNQADTSAAGAGAVYVFTRSAGTWTQQAYVKAANARAGANFGGSVVLSEPSGDALVVGSPAESSDATGIGGNQASTAAPGAGAVYVFGRTGTTWSQRTYIKASNARASSGFGFKVALSGDTLVASADVESSNAKGVNGDQTNTSLTNAGAAYVFTQSAGVWSQQAYLKASNTRAQAYFGSSVAIDGDMISVGSFDENSKARLLNGDQADTSAPETGAAYVFTRAGGAWSQRAYVKPSIARDPVWFGFSTAISGTTVVVGGNEESSNAVGVDGTPTALLATYSGAVYVY